MEISSTDATFAHEFERELMRLIDWAVTRSATTAKPLTQQDFAKLRYEALQIIHNPTAINTYEPEPDEGGAQYINVNPAPWP